MHIVKALQTRCRVSFARTFVSPVIFYKSTNSLKFSIILSENDDFGYAMKLCLLIFLFVFATSSWAQDKKDEAQINEIEDLFDEDAEQEERQVRQQFREKKEKRKTRKIKKLQD